MLWPRTEVLDVELRRSGSKGRPSGPGRQPVVEEKEAGKQTNISPEADTSISLQTRANISPQPLEIFLCGRRQIFLCKSRKISSSCLGNISDGWGSAGYWGQVETCKNVEQIVCVKIFLKADPRPFYEKKVYKSSGGNFHAKPYASTYMHQLKHLLKEKADKGALSIRLIWMDKNIGPLTLPGVQRGV